MRIAIAQINPTLGDFQGNAEKIISFSQRAAEKHAHVVAFCELSLFGYPANDWLEQEGLVERQLAAYKKVLAGIPKNLTVVFGAVLPNALAAKKGGKPFINAAVVARRGQKPFVYAKQLLPTYDVFDEGRFFEPVVGPNVLKVPGVGRMVVSVCEDMWSDFKFGKGKYYQRGPLAQKMGKVDLVVNLSGSPFSPHHRADKMKVAKDHVKRLKAPFLYVNQVGAQDELIFDGRSFLLDKKGKLIVEASAFNEDLVMIDLTKKLSEHRDQDSDDLEIMRKALVLGLQDFVKKTGQKRVHLGLSGGIDSALVAALAVDALGPARVSAVMLPGPYSSPGSVTDAEALAKNLKIKVHRVDINKMYQESLAAAQAFDSEGVKKGSVTDQNLQARLRAVVLMAYSNQKDSMLLSTSNKSEIAAGFCTLYGDSCGGLAPIGDLTKTQVYALSKLYNKEREIIPQAILDKKPSPELAPGQKTQDTLPEFSELDPAIENLVVEKKQAKTDVEKWLQTAIYKNEFKRWQAPPILRVSEHAFGRGRRIPLAKTVV